MDKPPKTITSIKRKVALSRVDSSEKRFINAMVITSKPITSSQKAVIELPDLYS